MFYDMLNTIDEALVSLLRHDAEPVTAKDTDRSGILFAQAEYVRGIVVHHSRGGGQSKEDTVYRCCTMQARCDFCFGQNKNRNMLAMLFALRKQCFPRLNIKYVFPMRGHSYLPANHVFGRIKKQLRNMDTVLLPSDYRATTARHIKVSSRSASAMLASSTLIDAVGMKDTYNGVTVLHRVICKEGRCEEALVSHGGI